MSFMHFAAAHGLLIRDLRDDGRIHRCPTSSKPRSDNGAYLFDGQRGWVMDWAAGDSPQWWNDPNARPWTEAEKAEWKRRQARQALDRLKQQAAAARQACDMIERARLVSPTPATRWRQQATPGHAYLIRKGFPLEPYFELDGDLLVPMFDAIEYRKPIGLQRINAEGDKKFLTGQRSKGAVFRLGSGRSREVWLCEGYATALSVRAALGALYRPADVVACFSAGNIRHVASLGIGTHVMADHDASGAGEQAAQATGLPYAMPAQIGMDANDVHRADGLEAVVELVGRRI